MLTLVEAVPVDVDAYFSRIIAFTVHTFGAS